MEDVGFPMDDALFALFTAWQRKEPLERPVDALIRLLETKADRMARKWAEWALPRLDAEREENDLPF